jgi:hypothetical protein
MMMPTEPKVVQFITPEQFGLERFPPGTTVLDLVTCRQAAEIRLLGCLTEELRDPANRLLEDQAMPEFHFNNETSQSDRRKVLENDRQVRSTYFEHAQSDPDLEMGGRFSRVNPSTVTGTAPGPEYPRLPSGPWSEGPGGGPEPPLGIDINAQEPTGEKHEVEASTADGTSAVEDASAVPVKPMHRMDTVEVRAAATVTRHPVVAAGFRRRF